MDSHLLEAGDPAQLTLLQGHSWRAGQGQLEVRGGRAERVGVELPHRCAEGGLAGDLGEHGLSGRQEALRRVRAVRERQDAGGGDFIGRQREAREAVGVGRGRELVECEGWVGQEELDGDPRGRVAPARREDRDHRRFPGLDDARRLNAELIEGDAGAVGADHGQGRGRNRDVEGVVVIVAREERFFDLEGVDGSLGRVFGDDESQRRDLRRRVVDADPALGIEQADGEHEVQRVLTRKARLDSSAILAGAADSGDCAHVERWGLGVARRDPQPPL